MCPFSLPFQQACKNFCPESTHPESSLCYFSYDFYVKVAKEKWFLVFFVEVDKIADVQFVILKILKNGEKDISDIILIMHLNMLSDVNIPTGKLVWYLLLELAELGRLDRLSLNHLSDCNDAVILWLRVISVLWSYCKLEIQHYAVIRMAPWLMLYRSSVLTPPTKNAQQLMLTDKLGITNKWPSILVVKKLWY